MDDSFILEPGEEKKAYFTIDIKNPGKTESNVNVKFIPEQGNGANNMGIKMQTLKQHPTGGNFEHKYLPENHHQVIINLVIPD